MSITFTKIIVPKLSLNFAICSTISRRGCVKTDYYLSKARHITCLSPWRCIDCDYCHEIDRKDICGILGKEVYWNSTDPKCPLLPFPVPPEGESNEYQQGWQDCLTKIFEQGEL